MNRYYAPMLLIPGATQVSGAVYNDPRQYPGADGPAASRDLLRQRDLERAYAGARLAQPPLNVPKIRRLDPDSISLARARRMPSAAEIEDMIADRIEDAMQARLQAQQGNYGYRRADINAGVAGQYAGYSDPRYFGPVAATKVVIPDDAAAGTFFDVVIPTRARARLSNGRIDRISASIQANSAAGGQLLNEPNNVNCSMLVNGATFRPIEVPLGYFTDTAFGTNQGLNQTDLVVEPLDEVVLRLYIVAALGGETGESSAVSITYDTSSRYAPQPTLQ